MTDERAKETQRKLIALLDRIETLLGDVRETVDRDVAPQGKVTANDGD